MTPPLAPRVISTGWPHRPAPPPPCARNPPAYEKRGISTSSPPRVIASRPYTATATQTGEWQGVAPTGNQVSWSGTNIFRFACGKIAESWGEADHVSLLQLIGPERAAANGCAGPEIVAATPSTMCTEDTPDKNLAIVRRSTDRSSTRAISMPSMRSPIRTSSITRGFPDVQGSKAVKQMIRISGPCSPTSTTPSMRLSSMATSSSCAGQGREPKTDHSWASIRPARR